ncbi:hypothetical protein IWW50_001645 [Coemansia erecta]|nr:hypothetical protein IWW50_001645 [Coemansia erecta]
MSTSPKITEAAAIEKFDLPNKVFVGNLPFKTTDEELKELFEKFGEVAEARAIRRGKRSLGYGFVAFVAEASVAKAVAGPKLQLDEREINVEEARPMSQTEPKAPAKRRTRRARKAKEGAEEAKEPQAPKEPKPAAEEGARKRRTRAKKPEDGPPSETVAYVGNLPFATTDDELSALFAGFKISSARIVTNRKTNRSKGYGFVTFASNSDQNSAIAKFTAEPLVVDERPLNIKAALSESPAASDSVEPEASA